MPRIVLDPNAGYPPRWGVFDRYVTIASCAAFGFAGTSGDVNRFAARYRAARSFSRVEFDNLTATTARGYSELCNLLLAYSAFEYYLKAVGLTLGNSDTLISVSERAKTLAQIRSLQGDIAYFQFVYPLCGKGLKYQLNLYFASRVCNPYCLVAAARHAFVHGALTPNPASLESGVVEVITRLLRKVVMRTMERDFEHRMQEFERCLRHDA